MRATRGIAAVVLLALILIAGASCAWRVEPPSAVSDPEAVFLTQYGRHTRLALPASGTALIEYGFGEWRFYGLEEQGILSGARAIGGFGTAARSRRVLPAASSEAAFLRGSGGIRTARIVVERSAVVALQRRLERQWEDVRAGAVERGWDGVSVAPDARAGYHLFRNSNHATAGWLRELGCRVSGQPIGGKFYVVRDAGD